MNLVKIIRYPHAPQQPPEYMWINKECIITISEVIRDGQSDVYIETLPASENTGLIVSYNHPGGAEAIVGLLQGWENL